MSTSRLRTVRVATYNVHKCRGLDRRVRPDRIAAVLREVDADIVGLQEVVSITESSPEEDQARYLSETLSMPHLCFGENRRHGGGAYGNVTMSRYPLAGFCNFDITRAGREPRGCLRSDVQVGDQILHIFNLHLGTGFMERRHQAERIISNEILRDEKLPGKRIILGDFNEWTRGKVSRMLSHHFKSVDLLLFHGSGRTYPGIFPLLHLDHIYYDSDLKLRHFELHRTKLAVLASDHLPLVADFELPQ